MPDVREGVAAFRNAYVETRRDNAIAQSFIAFRRRRTIVTINYALSVANDHTRCKEALGGGGFVKVATTSFHIETNYSLHLAKERNYGLTMVKTNVDEHTKRFHINDDRKKLM